MISCSCFLIDMKFKFKLGCCLIMENVSFSIPPLRKIIFKIYTQKNHEKIRGENKNETKSPPPKTKQNKSNNLLPRTYRFRNFSKIWCPILTTIICFQDDSITFLVFVEAFWWYSGGLRVQILTKFSKFPESFKKYPKMTGDLF